MVSIAKKHGINPTTIPLIQRVKDWIKWFEEIHQSIEEDRIADYYSDLGKNMCENF